MQQKDACLSEIIIRFIVGGAIVSAFAVLGDLFRPKSFAGIFAAAPSVALATLALTVMKDGPSDGALEARSMIAGALALAVYSQVTAYLLMRHNWSALAASLVSLAPWCAVAFGLWAAFLR